MPRQRNRQDEPFESEAYRKLVADLKGIIGEAKAKGIDLNERMDTLFCAMCTAYGDITSRGHHIVVDPNRQTATMGQFLIVDSKQKIFQRKNVRYFRTTYTFICCACGAYQNAVIRDRFAM